MLRVTMLQGEEKHKERAQECGSSDMVFTKCIPCVSLAGGECGV